MSAITYSDNGWSLQTEQWRQGNSGPYNFVHYVWGRDLSGTLDGAGAVGGLLATEVDGTWYFPLYDNNGNVTDYVSETGEVVASYAYDAFGRTITQSGTMADVFPFRFSTKYYDAETGLYYYGYRYYSPELGRWLTRDPIEEDGGDNLYAFCGNYTLLSVDPYGLSTFLLIYDSVDPMFRAWAEDSSRRLLSNSATPYSSPSIKFDSKKDTIVMVPITGIETIENLSQYRDVKYLATFGHGGGGKIWWWYHDGEGVDKSVVAGIDGFGLNEPSLVSIVPFSKLVLDFNKSCFMVEFYHCSSAQEFEVDENKKLVFPSLEEVYPKLASPASARSASVISFYKDLIKRKYPKTKFSIVGAKGGVSNGTPWNRGWPRPVGHATKRLKEAP